MSRRALIGLAVAALLAVKLAAIIPRAAPVKAAGRTLSTVKGAVDVTGSPTLLALFERFDRAHRGKLSESDLAPYLTEGRDQPIDANGDGTIDKTEFLESFLAVNYAGESDSGVFVQHDLHHCQSLLDAGHLEEAAAAGREAVKKYPGSEDAWTLLAQILERSGKFAEARQAWTQELKIAPDDLRGRAGLAFLSLALEPPARASKAVDSLLEAIDTRLKTGALHPLSDHDLRECEELLVRLVNYHQDTLRDSKRSLEILDWGLKRLPKSTMLVSCALYSDAENGDQEKRLAMARELAKSPEAAFSMNCLQARIHLHAGRYDQAASCYREALRHDAGPEQRQDAMVQLYDVLASYGHREQAVELLREQLLPSTQTLQQARRLASRLVATGSVETAIEQLELTLPRETGNPEHWCILAGILEYRNDHAGRHDALRQALAQCGSREEVAREIRGMLSAKEPSR